MKRLALLLVALMVAPVFASKDGLTRKQRKDLEKFKKQATAEINAQFTIPKNSGVFEVLCSDARGHSFANDFLIEFSTGTDKDIQFPNKLFQQLNKYDGFCIFGPVNLEVRKQEALKELDLQVEFFKKMLRAVNQEKLHQGKGLHPKPKAK